MPSRLLLFFLYWFHQALKPTYFHFGGMFFAINKKRWVLQSHKNFDTFLSPIHHFAFFVILLCAWTQWRNKEEAHEEEEIARGAHIEHNCRLIAALFCCGIFSILQQHPESTTAEIVWSFGHEVEWEEDCRLFAVGYMCVVWSFTYYKKSNDERLLCDIWHSSRLHTHFFSCVPCEIVVESRFPNFLIFFHILLFFMKKKNELFFLFNLHPSSSKASLRRQHISCLQEKMKERRRRRETHIFSPAQF